MAVVHNWCTSWNLFLYDGSSPRDKFFKLVGKENLNIILKLNKTGMLKIKSAFSLIEALVAIFVLSMITLAYMNSVSFYKATSWFD